MKQSFNFALACLMSGPLLAENSEDASAAETARCVSTASIESYEVLSDEQIRLRMKDQFDILLKLRNHCDQLHYHDYFTTSSTGDMLCARQDDILTRTGIACRIESLTEIPKQATPVADTTPKGGS